jgi:hypothetical protein
LIELLENKLKEPIFNIIESEVGYEKIGLNNKLGWTDNFCNLTLSKRNLDNYETISAHAPSYVKLKLNKQVNIFGFMNCSAYLDKSNPIEYWIDYNYIGTCFGPGNETKDIVLQPGEHVLQIFNLGLNACGRHSGWAMQENINKIDVSNIAVITIGSYHRNDVKNKINKLAYSANKFNIDLIVKGVDENYHNHFHSKVEKMIKWIEKLPERYKYILYIDGRDSIFVKSLSEIFSDFTKTKKDVIVGAECCCWPYREQTKSQEWIDSFPARSDNRRFVCAGTWMGYREDCIKVLEGLIKLRNKWFNKDFTGLEDIAHIPALKYRDDQIFWQIGYLKGLYNISVDNDANLFANICCSDNNLINNNDFNFDPFQVKSTGTYPGILHFSGSGGIMDKWAGRLGAI